MESTSKGRKLYTHLPDRTPIDVIFKLGNRNSDYFLTEEGVLDFVYRKLKTLRAKLLKEKAKLAVVKAQSNDKESKKTKRVDKEVEVIDLSGDTEIEPSSGGKGKKAEVQLAEKDKRSSDWSSSSDSDDEGDDDDEGEEEEVDVTRVKPPEISPRKLGSSCSKQTTLNYSIVKKKRSNNQVRDSQSKVEKKIKLSDETLQVQKEEKARKAERRVFHHYHDDDNSGFTINPERPAVIQSSSCY